MNHIDSYNSSYPLAYYDIGTVYSFYGQPSQKGTPAAEAQVRRYASVLNQLNEKKTASAIQPVGKVEEKEKLNRFYAVVVDKRHMSGKAFIQVMYCNIYVGRTQYYTKYYAVNTDCLTNDKNLMPVSSHLEFAEDAGAKVKTGGITLAGKENRTGGITRADSSKHSSGSVGGITRSTHSPKSVPQSSKVGGITLVRENRVGGITRAKK